MTTLFSRLGPIESRIASTARVPHPPRKRNWICADCRHRGAQRRPLTTADAGQNLDGKLEQGSARGGFERTEEAIGNSWRTVDSLWERVRRVKPEAQALQPPTVVTEERSTDSPSRYSYSKRYLYGSDGIDYRAELPIALARGDPDAAVRAFLAAAEDTDYVRDIPPATFTELLRTIDSTHFIEGVKLVHNELSAHYAKQLHVYPVHEVLADFIRIVRDVTAVRKSAGVELGLRDYKLLLKCASAVGNKDAAKGMWEDLHQDGHIPDTDCYNYYLTSVIWHRHYRARARHKIRVIQNNIAIRSAQGWRRWLKIQWAFDSFRMGPGGIKDEVTKVFNEMLRKGNMPNERTFTLMMSGLAREGDVAGVKSILKKVWNVDVGAIMGRGKDKHKNLQVTPYPQESPLYPSQYLLFMVAHCFGINNDIPTALRVVDFISRNYNITISRDTWEQLLQWTFVLSLPRSGRKLIPGQKEGQLPGKAVEELWKTMTSEPYNIKPTMPMYNRLIKNMTRRYRAWEDVGPRIQEGHRLYRKSIVSYHRARQGYLEASKAHEHGAVTWQSLARMKRNLELLWLIKRRNHMFVRRWTRLYLGSASKWKNRDTDWERGEASDFLRKMGTFAPRRVSYAVSGGSVAFINHSREKIKASHARKRLDALPVDSIPLQLAKPPRWRAGRSGQQAPVEEKAPVDHMEELMRTAAAHHGARSSSD
ncbi:hypothetical protein W97_03341 [Coniosporium apollinis CBS 100218]|uniref:Pentatricopeptide repeat domain-containing protein n=1 Tax=Coniosporium apollinis (strain CBS 100218) TaxID=1168221 RepID=R7YR63_CONA1|nr:uncharacterized protein W97_03341 [Coniosporium apollinis CBS 100218]EON64111.1 hypothetical protein W97_03341 [Coniosporium apollinis CBS 100218]